MAKMELRVPDIGDFKEVEVIEVLVKAGDVLVAEQSVITVESDKASMEIPASFGGTLLSLSVKVGDKVGEGSLLGVVEAAGTAAGATGGGGASTGSAGDADRASRENSTRSSSTDVTPAVLSGAATTAASAGKAETRSASPEARSEPPEVRAAASAPAAAGTGSLPHASPSVRKFARELGVDLSRIQGSGPKGRITADDVRGFVKGVMSGTAVAFGGLCGGWRRGWPGSAALAEGRL